MNEDQNDQSPKRRRGGQLGNKNGLMHGGRLIEKAVHHTKTIRLDGRTRAGKAVARICADLGGNATEMQTRTAKGYVFVDEILTRLYAGVRGWATVSKRKKTAAPWLETVMRLGNLHMQYSQLLGMERKDATALDLARRLQYEASQQNGGTTTK